MTFSFIKHFFFRAPRALLIVIGGIVAIVFLSIGMILYKNAHEQHTETHASGVEATVETYPPMTLAADGEMTITLSGIVEADQEADITAQVSGSITRLLVGEGDSVSAGDLLIEIDHASTDAQLAQARAAYNQAYTTWSSGKKSHALSLESSEKKKETSVASAQAVLDRALRTGVDTGKSTLLSGVDALIALAQSEDVVNDSFYNAYRVRAHKSEAILILLGAERAGSYDAEFIASLFGGVREEITLLSDAELLDTDTVLSILSEMRNGFSALLSAYEELQTGMYYTGTTQPNEVALFESGETSVREGLIRITSLEGSITEAVKSHNTAMQIGDVSVRSSEESEQKHNDVNAQALALAEAKVAELEAMRAHAFIRAPFSGIVSDIYISEGDVVHPTAHLVSLSGNTDWKIVADVADTYNTLLELGASAEVSIDGIANTATGFIDSIVPAVDTDSHSMRIEIQIPNSEEKMRPGLFARIALSLSSPEGVYTLPREYVGYDYGGPYLVAPDNTRMPVHIVRDTGKTIFVSLQESLTAHHTIIRP